MYSKLVGSNCSSFKMCNLGEKKKLCYGSHAPHTVVSIGKVCEHRRHGILNVLTKLFLLFIFIYLNMKITFKCSITFNYITRNTQKPHHQSSGLNDDSNSTYIITTLIHSIAKLRYLMAHRDMASLSILDLFNSHIT